MKSYIDRMIVERDLLKDKLEKIHDAVINPPAACFGLRYELLVKQEFYMNLYFSVLNTRIGIEKDELRKQNAQN